MLFFFFGFILLLLAMLPLPTFKSCLFFLILPETIFNLIYLFKKLSSEFVV